MSGGARHFTGVYEISRTSSVRPDDLKQAAKGASMPQDLAADVVSVPQKLSPRKPPEISILKRWSDPSAVPGWNPDSDAPPVPRVAISGRPAVRLTARRGSE